jgi:hypothetical protein
MPPKWRSAILRSPRPSTNHRNADTIRRLAHSEGSSRTGTIPHESDDYGGSNDIGYSPMYGAYDGAYDGSWNWSPGYYPSAVVINIGPVD